MLDRSELAAEGKQTMTSISELLQSWTAASPMENYATMRTRIHQLRDKLQSQKLRLSGMAVQRTPDHETLSDAYAAVGSLWTVIRSIEAANAAFARVDCDQIGTPRF